MSVDRTSIRYAHSSDFPALLLSRGAFMYKERERSPSPWDLSELSFGLFGLVESSRERLFKLRSAVEGHKVIESAHKNWDNTNYCRSLSQDAPHQYTYQELLNVFPANFRTFTDEYCLGTLVQEYPLVVDQRGMRGLDDTYKETLTEQAQRFEERLARTGKRQQRQAVETFNSQRLDLWLRAACQNDEYPIGTKLVWCSPPGFKVEGYHGTSSKHHSFIWVYEKEMGADGKPKMTMTQFRCWPNLKQMENIQRQLRERSHETGILDNSDPTFENQKLTRRNQVISEFIELPPEVSMDEIEDVIYKTEDDWAVGRADMPSLTEMNIKQFEAYRDGILNQFLIPVYQATLAPMYQLTEPYDSPFWRSPEYVQLIKELDLAFAIAWQNLLKYVEAVDQNSKLVPEDRPALPSLSQVSQLREIYMIKLKADDGKASKEDRLRFNEIAPQLLSVGSTALSVGQCGIGTLIPVQLFKGIESFSSFQGFNSLSQLTKFDIAKLSAAEKLAFREDVLGHFKPMTITGRFGQKQKFWVRSEYYQQYVQGSKQLSSGEFVGPCDIPLTDGSDAFVLTDAKYQELFGAVSQPDLSGLAQIDGEESRSLAEATSEEDREWLRAYFDNKRKKLKNRVSITELVNNDLTRPTFARV